MKSDLASLQKAKHCHVDPWPSPHDRRRRFYGRRVLLALAVLCAAVGISLVPLLPELLFVTVFLGGCLTEVGRRVCSWCKRPDNA